MATYADNGIEIIAHLPGHSKDAFRSIWQIESLRIAKTDDGFWIKGFSSEDLKNPILYTIPNLQWFELKDHFLYVKGRRVPERKGPSGLLWSPIQQALTIELPSYNENLFEVNGKLNVELSLSSEEQETSASIVKLDELLVYVDTVPEHFFNTLKWCKMGDNEAILIGTTVLQIVSKRFWKVGTLFIPAGFDFHYSFLKDLLTDLKQKSETTDFWIFNQEGYHFALPQALLVPLTRSSVKSSLAKC